MINILTFYFLIFHNMSFLEALILNNVLILEISLSVLI